MLKGRCCKLTAIVIATAVVLAGAIPVLAAVSVSPVSMEGEVSVGKNTLPAITVTNTDEDKPVRIKAEVMGFGQTPRGTTIPIEDDDSPCSGVSLIKLSPEKFEVKPGESQKVKVTCTIPPEATGGKYATIVVGQVPESGVSMVGQVAVAVTLTISQSSLLRSGQIMGVDIHQEQLGEPLTFITTVRNQGNVHIRPIGEIIISQEGQEIGRAEVEPHLILPGYARQLKTEWSTPEVKAGTYSFEVALNIDGIELTSEGSFTLSDTESVIKVEGGVGEPREVIVPPQQQSGTSATQPMDWRLVVEIAGGVLILAFLIYLIVRRRRGY